MIAATIISSVALISFVYQTSLFNNAVGPLFLYAIMMFVLTPFRKESFFVKRLMLLCTLIFVLWMLSDLGMLLLPFILSFALAYLLDPLVTLFSRWKINRSIVSMFMVLMIVGIIVLISIFVFPQVFSQINDVIKKLSSMVTSTTQYLESKQFYRWLESFGIQQDQAKEIVQQEVVPRLEEVSNAILKGILNVLSGLSSVLAQAINAILIPILTFYFLNDLPQLKMLIHTTLSKRNSRLHSDLLRINTIVRSYIGGQIISATFVGTMATTLFLIFDIPYAVVLGVLCGLLNPIPYVGILASLFVAIITILIVDINNAMVMIIEVVVIVNILHFITTYIIDPRVTGSRVGLHPVVLIASLFVFGHFFGFIGLIVAVPATAILMMYFQDWMKSREAAYAVPVIEEVKKESIK